MGARSIGILAIAALSVACSDSRAGDIQFDATLPPTTTPDQERTGSEGRREGSDGEVLPVTVTADRVIGPISPLVRGLSGGVDREFLLDVGATLNSWGGNPATRFNFEIGHAWNAGADWEYRNGNYGQSGDAARDFITESAAGGAAVRLAVPTLGWVARDDDNATCSFPTADGCDGGAGHDCANPGPVADPTRANVATTPEMVAAWVQRLVVDEALPVSYVAMDNEPELWGVTHYDVHPTCTTYEEVLDRYLAHADAVLAVAPEVELMGPVSCCWFDYWGIAPGPADGSDADYLTWFLDAVRRHDERTGTRSLHLLDVRYYPQSDVYNDAVDEATAARRLRSTRSLWDRAYVDESWIDQPIAFVPRMLETIAAAYPGTRLAISEWSFGADGSMNGALAIADVLAILGREGVEAASYWQHPAPASPGYFAFKIHGNYDDRGSRFGGDAVEVATPDVDRVGAYAALDRAGGRLQVLLINKDPAADVTVPVAIGGVAVGQAGAVYRYTEDAPDGIVRDALAIDGASFTTTLPASSITLVELTLAG